MTASAHGANRQGAQHYGRTLGRHRRQAKTLGERAAVPAQARAKLAVAGLIGAALAAPATVALAAPATAAMAEPVPASPATSTGPATLTAAIAPIHLPSPQPFSFDLTPGPPYPSFPAYPGTGLGAFTIIDGPRTITFSGNSQDPVHITDLSQPQALQEIDMAAGGISLTPNHCFLDSSANCTQQLQPGTYNAGDVFISYLPIIPASGDSGADRSSDQFPVLNLNYGGSQPNSSAQNPNPANMFAGDSGNGASPFNPDSTQPPAGVSGVTGIPTETAPSAPVSSVPPADENPAPTAVADDQNGSPPTVVADNNSSTGGYSSSIIDDSSFGEGL